MSEQISQKLGFIYMLCCLRIYPFKELWGNTALLFIHP